MVLIIMTMERLTSISTRTFFLQLESVGNRNKYKFGIPTYVEYLNFLQDIFLYLNISETITFDSHGLEAKISDFYQEYLTRQT